MTRISLAALAGAAILAGSATVAAAQQDTTPPSSAHSGARTARGARAQQRGDRALLRGITLTDAQKTQIEAVRAKYRTEGKELRDQMKASREKNARPDSATMARRRTLMENERNDMRAILTPEQRATFDQNLTKLRESMTAHRGKRRSGH
jgi:Spy/CpxP family protein refolding chaperone